METEDNIKVFAGINLLPHSLSWHRLQIMRILLVVFPDARRVEMLYFRNGINAISHTVGNSYS